MRRTSEIGLIDQDDTECIQAKGNLYRQVGGRWEIDKAIAHRQMSNNSIFYRRKPTREQLHWHLKQMRYSGEPGWVNEVAGLKRRPNFLRLQPLRRDIARQPRPVQPHHRQRHGLRQGWQA